MFNYDQVLADEESNVFLNTHQWDSDYETDEEDEDE